MEASTARRLRFSVGRGVGRAEGARMGQRPVTPMMKVVQVFEGGGGCGGDASQGIEGGR